jgi:hypothetical protein
VPGFEAPAKFRAAAANFLASGLAASQRVMYFAEAAGDNDLDEVAGFRVSRATGQAGVRDRRIYDTLQSVISTRSHGSAVSSRVPSDA